MRLQSRHQGRRQHRQPILAALAMTHRQLVTLEIDILDPQPHAFHQTHACSVEKTGHQRMRPVHRRQQALDLTARQHDGGPFRLLRPIQVSQPGQIDAEHFAIQKEQRRQGLLVRRRRYLQIRRQMPEKRPNLVSPHFPGVTPPMKSHEATHPLDITAFCPYAVVLVTDDFPNPPQQGR